MERIVRDLEDEAARAERSAALEEDFLAKLVEAMERRDHARRAAARARADAARLQAQQLAEERQLHRNALQRERYRQRRLREGPQGDRRLGTHALRIEVDPEAWRALKVEAVRRRTSISRLLGEILTPELPRLDGRTVPAPTPRWRRTGGGRRARQFARVEIDEAAWTELRADAVLRSMTVARRIGFALEAWTKHSRPGSPSDGSARRDGSKR